MKELEAKINDYLIELQGSVDRKEALANIMEAIESYSHDEVSEEAETDKPEFKDDDAAMLEVLRNVKRLNLRTSKDAVEFEARELHRKQADDALSELETYYKR